MSIMFYIWSVGTGLYLTVGWRRIGQIKEFSSLTYFLCCHTSMSTQVFVIKNWNDLDVVLFV